MKYIDQSGSDKCIVADAVQSEHFQRPAAALQIVMHVEKQLESCTVQKSHRLHVADYFVFILAKQLIENLFELGAVLISQCFFERHHNIFADIRRAYFQIRHGLVRSF